MKKTLILSNIATMEATSSKRVASECKISYNGIEYDNYSHFITVFTNDFLTSKNSLVECKKSVKSELLHILTNEYGINRGTVSVKVNAIFKDLNIVEIENKKTIENQENYSVLGYVNEKEEVVILDSSLKYNENDLLIVEFQNLKLIVK